MTAAQYILDYRIDPATARPSHLRWAVRWAIFRRSVLTAATLTALSAPPVTLVYLVLYSTPS